MLRALVVSCVCLVAAPVNAAAEWHITPLLGMTFAGKTTITDLDQATGKRHPDAGISVTLLGPGIVGVEGLVSLTPGFFQSGRESGLFPQAAQRSFVAESRVWSAMGNVVVTVPRRWTEYFLRPFVSGGFGLMRVSKLETGAVFSTSTNLLGFNVGGGAVGFLTRSTGVRFDLRYFSTVRGTDHPEIAFGDLHLRYMTAAVGLVIRR